MIRKSAFAGKYYSADQKELQKQLNQCFLGDKGPGILPVEKENINLKFMIVPHAGLKYSGQCAAWAYNELAQSKKPQTIVIIGSNHNSPISALSLSDFESPMGVAKNDIEFTKKLSEISKIGIDEGVHMSEHTIEMQIPFITYITPKSKIVPLIVTKESDYKKIALDIKEVAIELNREILIVASSDFSHYGIKFNYTPFVSNPKENMYKLDKYIINEIMSNKPESFLLAIKDKNSNVCGKIPIAIGMVAMGNCKPKKHIYYTSADITGDYSNAVGYCSITFEKWE